MTPVLRKVAQLNIKYKKKMGLHLTKLRPCFVACSYSKSKTFKWNTIVKKHL